MTLDYRIKAIVLNYMNSLTEKANKFLHHVFLRDKIPNISNLHQISNLHHSIKQEFIVSTKRGLFLISRSCLYKIFDGHYYGATLSNTDIYVFEKVSEKNGRILKIPYDLNKIDKKNVSVFLEDLSAGCHQIDIQSGYLYITDSYNNRVIKVDIQTMDVCEFFPKGTLDNGRNSTNYAHINSIYLTFEHVYLFCHNETKKTGIYSSILILNHKFELLKEIKTSASNGHNIINLNGDLIYCDSLNNALMANDIMVYKADMFTRGLSVTNDYFVLGGSEYARRKERERVKGKLYFINKKFNTICTVRMPGMVQEVRRINGKDYALSEK